MKRLFVAAMLAIPSGLAAQSGVELTGRYYWGPEVNSIHPCGTEVAYWVHADPEILAQLRDAVEEMTSEPYDPVHVRLRGWFDTGPVDGFADDYDGQWRVTRVQAIAVPAPGVDGCPDRPPPTWIGPVDPDCPQNNTLEMNACMTHELMAADGDLGRYVDEAYRLGADYLELNDETEQWEAEREATCQEAYDSADGGSIRNLLLLTCRLEAAEARTRDIWSRFLEGRDTVLPEPGRPGRTP